MSRKWGIRRLPSGKWKLDFPHGYYFGFEDSDSAKRWAKWKYENVYKNRGQHD